MTKVMKKKKSAINNQLKLFTLLKEERKNERLNLESDRLHERMQLFNFFFLDGKEEKKKQTWLRDYSARRFIACNFISLDPIANALIINLDTLSLRYRHDGKRISRRKEKI